MSSTIVDQEIDQELERPLDPVERPEDLLQHAERDDARDDGGPHHDVRNDDRELQVRPLGNVEVEVVLVEAEVVPPDVGEQLTDRFRLGAFLMVLARTPVPSGTPPRLSGC